MGLKVEKTTIGGHEYEASQFPAPKGMALLEWFMKKVGPGLETMFNEENNKADESGIFKGLGRVLRGLSGNDLQYLYDQFADSCQVGGILMSKDQIKQFHFSGRYGELLQWFIWMMKVNYESFFSEMGALKSEVEESPKQ
jgi:hypothetical protein